jgi:hypothetical protein
MEFLQFIFDAAMFPYTALLLLMLLYWVVVMLGALDMEFLDGLFGAADGAVDGAVEGAVEGVVEGAVEGAVEGVVEGAVEGVVEGAAEGVVEGAVDGVVEGAAEGAEGALEGAAEGAGSAFRAVLCFINLGQVPATLVLSVLTIFMWFEAYMIHRYAPVWLRDWLPLLAFPIAVFVVSFLVAYFLTGVSTRPLRRYFRHVTQHGHEHLIGSICKVRSRRVTPTIGRAELTVGDSFLTIDVRAPETEELTKRDEAVIVQYDKDSDTYELRKL